ncbi:MAG: TonB-dependent receptor [Deltaproteobacteria bacterium]|jgi:iron complex outermembrane receptor protein
MTTWWLLFVASQACTFEGRVVDATTGEAIEDARVRVAETSTNTDVRGDFAVDAPCGRQDVIIERADYRPHQVSSDGATPIRAALEPYRITRMDDVVVSAPALRREDTRSAVRLEGEALARTRGRTLADALAEVSGVEVLRAGAVAKPIVRGQSGARVLVLFDGVRHESQDWGLDHGPEIDPFAAGALTVVKGAAAVRYGADALGGVLLVEPHALRTEPGLEARADVVGALNGRRGTFAGRVDGNHFDALSWRIEGNVSRGAALSTPDYPLDNTGVFEWNAGARAKYQGEGFGLELSLRHNDLTNGVCTCVENDTNDDFLAQLNRDRPQGYERYDVAYEIDRPKQAVTHDVGTLRFDAETDVGHVEATYAFQRNLRDEFDIVRRSIEGPQFSFDLRTHTVDVALEHTPWAVTPSSELRGTWGVFAIAQDNVFNGLPLIPNFRAAGGAAFAVERWVHDDYELEAGLRYEGLRRTAYLGDNAYERHVARGSLSPEDCTVSDDVAACPSTFHTASLSLGGLLRLDDFTSLKLDLSTASRMPTIDEQYINGTAPSFPILALGRPDASPETSWSASTTFVLRRDALRAEASIYGSYVDGYIGLTPALDADGQPIVDVLVRGVFPRFETIQRNVLFGGADFDGSFRAEMVEMGLRASAIFARDLERAASVPFLPPPRGTAYATYHLLEGDTSASATASATYVFSRGGFDAKIDLAPPPDAYTLLGLSAAVSFVAGGVDWDASVELSNLLNARYRDYTSLLRYYAHEPGRQLILRVGATFGAS